jgi:uncharacterized membrane protein
MKRFSVTGAIAAPPQRVWQIMSGIDRWPEWTPSISSVKRLGDGLFRVGMRAIVNQPKLPPTIWTVTEIEPGRSFTWVSGMPGARVRAYHVVVPAGGGSEATLSIEIRGLLSWLVARLTAKITRQYLDLEMRGLKSFSETGRV